MAEHCPSGRIELTSTIGDDHVYPPSVQVIPATIPGPSSSTRRVSFSDDAYPSLPGRDSVDSSWHDHVEKMPQTSTTAAIDGQHWFLHRYDFPSRMTSIAQDSGLRRSPREAIAKSPISTTNRSSFTTNSLADRESPPSCLLSRRNVDVERCPGVQPKAGKVAVCNELSPHRESLPPSLGNNGGPQYIGSKDNDRDSISSYKGASSSPSSLQNAAKESGTSESGWTAYFNWSSDSWASSHSILEGTVVKQARDCLIADTSASKPILYHYKPGLTCEDSSMASDASSGPARPFFQCQLSNDRSDHVLEITNRNKRRLQATSNTRQALDSRLAKLRRLQSSTLQIPAPAVLEDTATSPLHSPDGSEGAEKEAGTVRNQTNQSSKVSSEWQSEAIDNRLETLQTLIPNGKELSKEEMLRVTVDYVRALELEVKMFDSPGSRGRSSGKKTANVASDALKERGLCVMPLSCVANVL